MSAGKAVIAADNGGCPKMITHGKTGLLVALGDVQGLAEAIILLLKEPGQRTRLGREALRVVNGRFSPEENLNKIIAVYSDISKSETSSQGPGAR